jgi:hypothetical protein
MSKVTYAPIHPIKLYTVDSPQKHNKFHKTIKLESQVNKEISKLTLLGTFNMSSYITRNPNNAAPLTSLLTQRSVITPLPSMPMLLAIIRPS